LVWVGLGDCPVSVWGDLKVLRGKVLSYDATTICLIRRWIAGEGFLMNPIG
jgi:hypothetical protein